MPPCSQHLPFPLRSRHSAWCLLAFGLTLARPGFAQDLPEDVGRVVAAWQPSALRVTKLAPRFLQVGQTLPLRLPESFLQTESNNCTSLVLLAPRTASFTLVREPEGPLPTVGKSDSVQRSAAGVISLSRCGAQRSDFNDLGVRLNSGRATLETIVAEGTQAAPLLDPVLPERQSGPLAALGDVGTTPEVEPLGVRAADAEARIQAEGGRLFSRRILPTVAAGGGGTVDLQLPQGCHRLVLLPDTLPGRSADVDAELHDRQDRVLTRDRSNATDSVLELCVGESTPVELLWVSSNRSAKVTLLQGSWAIPTGIPFDWGARARASLASSHRKRHSPALSTPPQWQGQGLPGRTSIAIEVAPEGCYVVGVAPFRGDLRSVNAAVFVGASAHHDTSGGGFDSAMVAFCASGARIARLDVEASGHALVWTAGLWRVGSKPLGVGEAW